MLIIGHFISKLVSIPVRKGTCKLQSGCEDKSLALSDVQAPQQSIQEQSNVEAEKDAAELAAIQQMDLLREIAQNWRYEEFTQEAATYEQVLVQDTLVEISASF